MIPELLSRYGYRGFLILGAVAMVALTVMRRQRYNLSVVRAVCFPVLLLVCDIIGAKLLFFVNSGFTSFNGMQLFGSVYLALLVMPRVGRLLQLKPAQTLDICAICGATLISFMRFGCFCAGCCGGIRCNIGQYRFFWPTQLMEATGALVMLWYLLQLDKDERMRGMLAPVFLTFYGIMRFFLEFLRDTPKNAWRLSEGQLFSLLGIVVGIVWLWRHHKKFGRNTCS